MRKSLLTFYIFFGWVGLLCAQNYLPLTGGTITGNLSIVGSSINGTLLTQDNSYNGITSSFRSLTGAGYHVFGTTTNHPLVFITN